MGRLTGVLGGSYVAANVDALGPGPAEGLSLLEVLCSDMGTNVICWVGEVNRCGKVAE